MFHVKHPLGFHVKPSLPVSSAFRYYRWRYGYFTLNIAFQLMGPEPQAKRPALHRRLSVRYGS